MNRSKIAISIDAAMLAEIDRLVEAQVFPSRSQAIQSAVEEKLRRLKRERFVEECAKMDPGYEQAFAEQGLGEDFAAWPRY